MTANHPPKIIHYPAAARTAQGQCDCACVSFPPVARPATPAPTDGYYTLREPFLALPVTAEYTAVLTGVTPSTPLLNQSALALARRFTQPRRLADGLSGEATSPAEPAALNYMIQLGLLVPTDYRRLPVAETPVTLSAWLHVTDRCNLRCAYCYLPHQPGDLAPQTGREAVAATFRSASKHHYAQVKLKYAGGEPLLRLPNILSWHHYARQLAEENRLQLDEVILSNGTLLTEPMAEKIQSAGLRLMISLDGLGKSQDCPRPYANGRDSTPDVMEKIELALAHGLTPDISVTVSGRSAAGLPMLVRWLLARNLPFSFNFCRQNDLSAFDPAVEETALIRGMSAAFAEIEANLSSYTLSGPLVDRASLSAPHRHPCGAGRHYLVFDPRGNVAKCQMQLPQPVASAQHDDPLAIIRADTAGLQNPPVEAKEACAGCAWQYWCAGGCPLSAYRAAGRYDAPSPYCHIYRALLPQAVRLEGLYRLQQAGEPVDNKAFCGNNSR